MIFFFFNIEATFLLQTVPVFLECKFFLSHLSDIYFLPAKTCTYESLILNLVEDEEKEEKHTPSFLGSMFLHTNKEEISFHISLEYIWCFCVFSIHILTHTRINF